MALDKAKLPPTRCRKTDPFARKILFFSGLSSGLWSFVTKENSPFARIKSDLESPTFPIATVMEPEDSAFTSAKVAVHPESAL